MVKYTNRDFERAGNIVDRFFEEERRVPGFTGDSFHLDRGFSVLDVELNASRFRTELEVVEDIGVGVPALENADGLPVPVSLVLFGGFQPPFLEPFGRLYPRACTVSGSSRPLVTARGRSARH
jgi:hypothetical protein